MEAVDPTALPASDRHWAAGIAQLTELTERYRIAWEETTVDSGRPGMRLIVWEARLSDRIHVRVLSDSDIGITVWNGLVGHPVGCKVPLRLRLLRAIKRYLNTCPIETAHHLDAVMANMRRDLAIDR
jgi:hypothetical protein